MNELIEVAREITADARRFEGEAAVAMYERAIAVYERVLALPAVATSTAVPGLPMLVGSTRIVGTDLFRAQAGVPVEAEPEPVPVASAPEPPAAPPMHPKRQGKARVPPKTRAGKPERAIARAAEAERLRLEKIERFQLARELHAKGVPYRECLSQTRLNPALFKQAITEKQGLFLDREMKAAEAMRVIVHVAEGGDKPYEELARELSLDMHFTAERVNATIHGFPDEIRSLKRATSPEDLRMRKAHILTRLTDAERARSVIGP